MSWSSEQVFALIDEYKKYPLLYVCKHADYHNKIFRNKALEKITEALKCIRPTVTPIEVQKKFLGLRTTYNSERKKVLACKRDGMDYSPSLWYFQKMSFLNDHLIRRPLNLEKPAEVTLDHADNDYESFLPEEQESIKCEEDSLMFTLSSSSSSDDVMDVTPTHRPKRSNNFSKKSAKCIKLHSEPEESSASCVTNPLGGVVSSTNFEIKNTVPPKDADHIFGEFVASQLALITNSKLKSDVQYKIHGILHNALNNID